MYTYLCVLRGMRVLSDVLLARLADVLLVEQVTGEQLLPCLEMPLTLGTLKEGR
jgi:hypothetical protein